MRLHRQLRHITLTYKTLQIKAVRCDPLRDVIHGVHAACRARSAACCSVPRLQPSGHQEKREADE